MQTLSPTLLAAQRARGGVATVRLRVEDRELRWLPVLDDDTSTRQTAGTGVAGAILRARISAAGTLDVQRIVDPHSIAQWQNWSVLLSGVAPASDVALSALESDPARVRLFCTRTDGATFKLSWLQSSDGGQSWSAPADLVTGLSAADGALASANAQLFFHERSSGYLQLALRNGWEEGSWSLAPWTAGGALTLRFGVGLGYHSGIYLLASADEESTNVRRLRTGYYTTATHTFTSPVAIVPPGLPSSAFTPLYPGLHWADGIWHLAYLECLSSVLNYTQLLILHSCDGEHWSYACPVPVRSFAAPRRVALFSHAGDRYLAAERCIWRAALYDPVSADCVLTTADLLSYQIEEETGHGRALFELANPRGRYDCLGESGLPGAPLKPLARVVLERGYHTTAGEERLARPPIT